MVETGGFGLPHTLCYQSKVGPERWLQPALLPTLESLGRGGEQAALVIPIAFVSDHIETLSEIDIEARRAARSWGIRHFEDYGRVERLARIYRCAGGSGAAGATLRSLAVGGDFEDDVPENFNIVLEGLDV